MRRRENNQQPAPDIVTYENIIPNLFLINEPVYTELDLSVQHNLNSENAAAGINSTPLQKRDIKSYVDSVIYADLHKCWNYSLIIFMLSNPDKAFAVSF